MTYAPTAIDLSRLPAPDAIEAYSLSAMLDDFKARYLEEWNAARLIDTSIPAYDTINLETDPAIIAGEAYTLTRGLDRQRVNDGLKALLAPLSTGGNLDALVAGRNIERLTIIEATANSAAVMEGDASLLRRYLESFDLPAAGSVDRYLYEARKAWPQSQDKSLGLWDARVNGFDIHGRRGDTDVVIIGPAGRVPTETERKSVRDAVTATKVKPDAVSVTVLAATRVEYSASLVIEVPGVGPDPETLLLEAEKRIRAAALSRVLIGGEIPPGLLTGAAYGDGVIKVRDLAPVTIAPDPYKVPVLTSLTLAYEVR